MKLFLMFPALLLCGCATAQSVRIVNGRVNSLRNEMADVKESARFCLARDADTHTRDLEMENAALRAANKYLQSRLEKDLY